MTFPETLAAANAALNGIAAVLLVTARWVIRGQGEDRIAVHRKLMIAAVTVSAVFLASYVTRFAIAGDTPFQGEGPVRYVYFAILISHVLLAIVVLPMVLRTFYLGLKRRFDRHRPLARFTFPIWLYVSITGVIVYFMLYHYPA